MFKVIHLIPSFCAGGAERMLVDLVIAQKASGIHPIVIAFYGALDKSGELGIARLNEKNITVYKIVDYRMNRLNKILCILKVIRLIKINNPKIINSHLSLSDKMLCFISYFIKNEIKLVRTIHSIEQNGQYNRFYKIRIKELFKNNIACGPEVLVNEFTKKDTQYFINNGISYNLNNLDSKTLSKYEINVIVVGSFKKKDNHFVKGQDLIVEALFNAKMKSEICIHFLGEGLERQAIEKYVNDHNLNDHVNFQGIVYDVENYLSSSTVFLSASRFEGLPISVIEACRFGMPLILSKIKGHQIFEEFNCTFFENKSELSELFDLLVTNKDKFVFDQDSAKRSQEIFDINSVAKRYIKVYEK